MSKRAKKIAIAEGLNKAFGQVTNDNYQEALFPAGMGFQQVAFGQQMVSSTNTLFSNLRGYMISNMRQLLSEAYVELGLIRNLVVVPVEDGFRGGVTISSKQLTPEELSELQAVQIREGDLLALKEGIEWTRLFGGGGLVILTDQDPEKPLDIKALTRETPLEFKAADMWELFYDKLNVEGFNPAINDVAFEFYSYYGHKTHRSRVFKLKGLTAPSFVRPRLRGWGFSIVESAIRSINQHIKGVDLIFELLDEAKLDVYGMKNLADTLLMQNGSDKVRERVAIANRQKNFQTAIVLDSEDTYQQKELSFQGIAEIFKEIRTQVASDLRMPMLKLFGLGATGMNASSEDEIEVYNGMVESEVREKAKYDLIKMTQLRCQQLFGKIPTDLEVQFHSLRIVAPDVEEKCKTEKFNRTLQAFQAGMITAIEFRHAMNACHLLPISLDSNEMVIGKSGFAKQSPQDVAYGRVPGWSGTGGQLGSGSVEKVQDLGEYPARKVGDHEATDGPNRSDSEGQTPVINESQDSITIDITNKG